MLLTNFNIGRRLVFGFALLLSLMFFANVAAVFQFMKIEKLHTQMVDRKWVEADALHFITATTRANAVHTFELLIDTDQAKREQIYASILRNKLAIDGAFATLNAVDHAPEARALLDTAIELRGRYVASFTRVGELVSQGRQMEATALMKNETLAAIAALQAPISAFADFEKRSIAISSAETKRRIETSRQMMWALAIMGLLLGLIAARLITRSITQPIDQAVKIAQQVASGDLSGRVIVQGDDEMARLLHALQSMKDNLVSSRMRAVLDTTLDAVIQIDEQGAITGWNTQAEECFGWSRDQALGKYVHDLIIPPRYRQAHLQGIQRYLNVGKSKIFNTRIEVDSLHQTGREFPIELTIASIQTSEGTGFTAFVRDLTKRRRADAESRIAAIAFESMEGMLVIDAQMVILKVNDAFTRITGYSKDDVIGKKSSLFNTDTATPANFKVPKDYLVNHHYWKGEIFDRRKNGEVYPVWLTASAVVDSQAEITHYIVAFVDMTENKQLQEKIHDLSFTDLLTGLLNRRALHDRLQQVLAGSERRQDFGAILLVDLDNFKSFNDVQGRENGDLLLNEVVARIKNQLQDDDIVARIDGDAFAIVLADLDNISQSSATKAQQLGDQIHLAFTVPFHINEDEHRISASIGICLFQGNDVDADLLITHAEAAMYKAKQDGRNCTRFFDPATQSALEARFTLIAWLHKALPDQLRLYYQLQVDANGTPIGAEALIRWQHPEKGLISPAMFIPLAEESGLILPIGAWVIESACQQLALWSKEAAFSKLKIAVNVSAKQFSNPNFAEFVGRALKISGATPSLLKIELTEGVMVSDTDSVIDKMMILKKLGVCFSLDDFGTGYSSLAYLKRLPLDQLKIDQSFVRNLLHSVNDSAIVRAVINLGQSLGLEVIAEGVETPAQQQALSDYGCHQFQGYLFSKPVPLNDFETLIKNRHATSLSLPMQPA